LSTSTLGLVIEPLYFGTVGKRLFGCYHAPQSKAPRDCGVILCYPMAQEYIRSHRTYRQLAYHLSKFGFPVLRFDFYGCGDSEGNCDEGRIPQWLADVGSAIYEIRERCGPIKICLVGLRLGGTLAMMVAAERGDIDGIVLWDPVLSGPDYIEELATLHQERARHSLGKTTHGTMTEGPTEILGFPLTDLLLTDLQKIDLLSIRKRPANRILVIASSEESTQRQLIGHLNGLNDNVDYQHVPSPEIWIEKNKTVVPNEILKAVVSWISRVYP
jgi:alpha/beta superfamily hydrolase